MMVETYLRRGQRSLERAALSPRVRRTAAVAVCTGSGFLLSALGLRDLPQPVAMGLICSAAGWRALLMAVGAMLGYPSFWGSLGTQGIVWAASAGLLAILVGRKPESREQPLMLPVVGATLSVVTGLTFRLVLKEPTPWLQLPIRGITACLSGILFTQAARCRDPVTDWLVWAVGVLALARISPGLALGAGAVLAVGAPFPAAVLAGAALDLAGLTRIPMTAAVCLACFGRMLRLKQRWQRLFLPAAGYLAVAGISGVWEPEPLPALVLGGAAGLLLPPKPSFAHRRGSTGIAQVRLELGAQMLKEVGQGMLTLEPAPIDREALLEKARQRACGGCALRNTCPQQKHFSPEILDNPLDADCRKQGRLVPELRRAREQLRLLQSDRKRQREYRAALAQQYQFLSGYLRNLADRLPRAGETGSPAFRIELSVHSRGKEEANGDKCLAFSGPECRYFVVLCDGMGTGLGAAQESHAAGKLLRQMLTAGFPPDCALESLNSLLALGGNAAAVTVDLAEIALDTGIVHIYKWGAAPSWVLTRRGSEKIGTATPPPGMGVEASRMSVAKLSLRRGELLVLLSDGVEGAGFPQLSSDALEGPTGALADKILDWGTEKAEDDATAAVFRLRSLGVAPS